MQFHVRVKSPGAVATLLEREAYEYPAEAATRGSWTLREMIGHLVSSGLAAYKGREVQRKLIRVLTAEQLQDQAKAGKVGMGGREVDPPPVDEGRAVERACDAFTQGLYLVLRMGRGYGADTTLGARRGWRSRSCN